MGASESSSVLSLTRFPHGLVVNSENKLQLFSVGMTENQ